MSNPALRMQIIGKMQECRSVTCDSLEELITFFDLEGINTTQFKKALGSVQYKYGVLRVIRPGGERRSYEDRPYIVQFVSDEAASKALDVAQYELA